MKIAHLEGTCSACMQSMVKQVPLIDEGEMFNYTCPKCKASFNMRITKIEDT